MNIQVEGIRVRWRVPAITGGTGRTLGPITASKTNAQPSHLIGLRLAPKFP